MNPKTKDDIQEIINLVKYKDGFTFRVEEDGEKRFIQLCEKATCNRTGAPFDSKGRKWAWSPFMTKSEVVTTCLKAVLQYEEHEARENFKYQGVSIFDPHWDIEVLVEMRKKQGWDDVRESHGESPQ